MLTLLGVMAIVIPPVPPPQLEITVKLSNAIIAPARAASRDGRCFQAMLPLTFSVFLGAKKSFIRAYTFNVVMAP